MDLSIVGSRSQIRYRPDIDGMRAIAVSIVVAFHAFPQWMPGGFIGVDIFFVISGFLITGLILNDLSAGTWTLQEFYRRRARRILPALLLMFLLVAVLGWYVLLPGELRWLGESLSWCASFLANAFFARSGNYFDAASELNPLLHLWSLGVEEQFYFLWPLLLWWAVRRNVAKRLLLVICGMSFLFGIYCIWHSPGAGFFLLPTRAWELGAGGMLAMIDPKSRSQSRLPSLVGIGVIVAGSLWLNSDMAFPGIWGLLPTGAALLLIANPDNSINQGVLGARLMTSIGKLSYPLYLWHWPALAFARIVTGAPPTAAVTWAAVSCSCAAAYLTYRFVEAPIRAGGFPRAAIPAMVAGLLVVTALGWVVHVGKLEGRLSGPAIAALDEAINDWHYPGGFNFGKSSGFKTLQAASHRPQNVLFVGDSHIEQYWPRVKYLIDAYPDEARSALFATYVGCPPFPGINSARRGWSCDGFFKFVMEQASRDDVDSVVFGAFWEVYLLGEFSVDHTRQAIYSTSGNSHSPLELNSLAGERAFADFEQAVATLVHHHRRVFILLSNPTSPLFDPVSLVSMHARLASVAPEGALIEPSRQTIEAASFQSFVAPIARRLSALAARAGAVVIDPASTLCRERRCPAVTPQGMPLYMDSNHLRPFYSREHAVFLDPILLGAT
jgi:peptidoglycan/LPS O-acetylase OafA/YrhL